MLNAIIKFIFGSEYTSEIDLFLKNHDKRVGDLSPSQRNEREKYAKINRQRDEAEAK